MYYHKVLYTRSKNQLRGWELQGDKWEVGLQGVLEKMSADRIFFIKFTFIGRYGYDVGFLV